MAKDKMFSIGLEVKAKHGALLAALEERGWNQRQGAEFLGIDQTRFSMLINMKKAPQKISEELAIKLFELTGQTTEELWPKEVFIGEFLAAPKRLRSIRYVSVHLLAGAGIIPALPSPTPEESYGRTELANAVREVVKTLPPRECQIVHSYFIEGKTTEEIGTAMNVSAARVQQLRERALRLLRHPMRSRKLVGFHNVSP